MAANPDHPMAMPAWTLVGGEPMTAEKIDDYAIRFKFAASAPLLERELAAFVNGGVSYNFGPYPRHYLEQFHPNYSDAVDYEQFTELQDWWLNPDRPVLNAWMPVSLEPGNRLILERNPYYYAVDTGGNQLPYIDRLDVSFSENAEVLKLRIFNGDVNFHAHPHLSLRDLAVLKENEAKGDYRVLLWDNGAGGAPRLGRQLEQPRRRQAGDRAHNPIQACALPCDGPRSGFAKSPSWVWETRPAPAQCPQTRLSSTARQRGKKILIAWRDSAVTHDPELAASLLDEIDVTDQDGDGFRDLPDGSPLEVRIDFPAGNTSFIETAELMVEDWKAIGLNAYVNSIPGSQVGVMTTNATYDIRLYGGGAPDGPDLLTYPAWLISYGSGGRWAPLYGAWMAAEGTPKEGTELDLDPRDRTPPREEIPLNDPMFRMWELYKQAIAEPDVAKRDELTFAIIQIHIDEGPFLLGGIADPPKYCDCKQPDSQCAHA